MKVLDYRQIQQKVKRLALQILERHYGEPELILAGLNNNGFAFAQRLLEALRTLAPAETSFVLTRVRLNPAHPLEYAPYLDPPIERLQGKTLIVVDDVANTGRTLFFAMKPLLNELPRCVEVAVLVDRKHKSFPIHPDYVGLSLYTTVRDDIEVRMSGDEAEQGAYLR